METALFSNDLVSICIPAYNCEKFIAETLNCLLNQSYQNIEVIVVDDGSIDDTKAVVNKIQDKRLMYVWQENKGAAAARNIAYRLSKGAYIKFMDADDLINVDGIKNQLLKIKGEKDCIISSKWGRFFGDDVNTFTYTEENVWKEMKGIEWVVESLVDHGSNMTQPGIFLIPRNLIERFGVWDECLSLIDDFEFMTRLIVNCKRVLFCENAVLMYRSGIEASLSRSNSRKHMESAFKALTLGVNEILKIRSDSRSRLACANTLQLWAYTFYPKHMKIYNQTDARIRSLGGASISLKGGKYFVFISKIVGWKNTILFKRFILKLLKKKDFNSFRNYKTN
jgi:glycosyltransferase involved in cell wall biosynthesis